MTGGQGLVTAGAMIALPGLVDSDGPAARGAQPRLDRRRRRRAAARAARRHGHSRSASRTRRTSARSPSCGRARGGGCATSSTSRASSAWAPGSSWAASCSAARTASAASWATSTVDPGGERVRVRQPRLPRDARRARRDPAARPGWTRRARVTDLAERAGPGRARGRGAGGGRPLARHRRRLGGQPAQPARDRDRRLLRHAGAVARPRRWRPSSRRACCRPSGTSPAS